MRELKVLDNLQSSGAIFSFVTENVFKTPKENNVMKAIIVPWGFLSHLMTERK